MPVEFNHTIIGARDKRAAAQQLADLLGRPAPTTFGPFAVVALDNRVSLLVIEHDGRIDPAHYAFLIGDDDFDAVRARLTERGLTQWADPGHTTTGINTDDGGRGMYFENVDGHNMEVITVPYGGWP